MTTPAGWYDDGSGRQRWWDGEQWTEHFAPETAAPVETADAETHAPVPDEFSSEPSLDDTVVRPSHETVISPESTASDPAPEAAATPAHDEFAAAPPAMPAYEAPTTPSYGAPASPAYGAPASPAYGAPATPAYAAPTYPGSAQPPAGYPVGYQAGGAYPGAAPSPNGADTTPKKVSILGLVGLGLSVVGTIIVFIPLVGFFGFIVLAAGFIVSLISLFLKGKKWPGITGLILAIVGTVLGIVMSFVYLFALATNVSEEISSPSSSSTSAPLESEDPGTATGERPTAPEVAVGISTLIEATGAEGYTPEQIDCFANEFVNSTIDDETLRAIAESDGTFTDSDVVVAFTEEFGNALPICLVP